MTTITTEMTEEALSLARRVWEDGRPASAPVRRADGGGAWHVVHVAGGSDRHAIDFLEGRGLVVYYPQMRAMRPLPRKQLSRKQRASGIAVMRPHLGPLFPRYLFVRFDMGREGWRTLFDFAGIGGLVCAGDLPVRVPDALVDSLRAREIDGAVPGATPLRWIFALGETVTISDGPFAGFAAEVARLPDVAVEAIDADTRIRVAVNILGGVTPVDLAVGQIEKAR